MNMSDAPATSLNIHVQTQYMENYGTADAPYWKFKGGDTYVITGFSHPMNDTIGAAAMAAVESVRARIEYSNPMASVTIIDWEFAPADGLTQWERDQQAFEGSVTTPSPRIAL